MKYEKLSVSGSQDQYSNENLYTLSALYGASKCFRFLIANNFPIVPNTIMADAIEGGNPEIVHLVEQHFSDYIANVSIPECSVVCFRNDFLSWALDNYNTVNLTTEHSPLSLAIEFQNISAIRICVDHSIVNFVSLTTTPCLLAVNLGKELSLLTLLNEEKIDPNERTMNDDSALFAAVRNNNIKFIKHLLNCERVDVGILGPNMNSPLHCAVENGLIEIVKLLVDCPRVDMNAINGENERPVDLVKDPDLMELLMVRPEVSLKMSDYMISPMIRSIKEGNVNMLEYLLLKGVNPNSEGNTIRAIHAAASFPSTGPLKILLDHPGIKVNKQSKKGRTALHYAVLNNIEENIKLLIKDKRVDAAIKDRSGKTAYDYANDHIKRIFESYQVL